MRYLLNRLYESNFFSEFKTTFATFGGKNGNGNKALSDKVMLVDLDSKASCQHSTLPVKMKEVFIFDYKETMIACSAFVVKNNNLKNDKLRCYEWSTADGKWGDSSVISNNNNQVFDFISAVSVPGKFYCPQKDHVLRYKSFSNSIIF